MTKANPSRRQPVEPGIYRSPNNRFIVRYRDVDRVRDRTFDSLAEARRFKAVTLSERADRRTSGINLDDDTIERLADAIVRRLEAKR